MKATTRLTIFAIITAVLHMWAEYFGPPLQIYIFKPLTMILIITIAFSLQTTNKAYKTTVIVGLFFSMGGDILLMVPFDLFVPGLVSFLIAHLIYIYAFRPQQKKAANRLVLIPLFIYGLLIYFFLAPNLGDMKIPVGAYVIVILIMAWQAWKQWEHNQTDWAKLALIGAIIFVISDTILAINKFSQPFTAARLLTLTTYFSAQWLIANSITRAIKISAP